MSRARRRLRRAAIGSGPLMRVSAFSAGGERRDRHDVERGLLWLRDHAPGVLDGG